MKESIILQSEDDWTTKLRNEGASLVIDPVATRTAELFLGGRNSSGEQAWPSIKANMSSLAAFVDALVLQPWIPLFDYLYTFEQTREDLGPLEICRPVVVPVGVKMAAWADINGQVARKMGACAPVPSSLAAYIEDSLEALGWTYISRLYGKNDLSETKTAGNPSESPKVNSFLYIGLLFAAYAQQIGGTHMVTPDLSRLLLAAALESAEDRSSDARALFGELEQLSDSMPLEHQPGLTLHRPSFLPYLLTFDDRTPSDVIRRALDMRETKPVLQYREWMREVDDDLAKGRISYQKRRDVQRVARRLSNQLAPLKDQNVVTAGFQMSITGPSANVSKSFNLSRFTDWVVASQSGKRYQKLLLTLSMSQTSYFAIDRHIEQLWSSA